MKNTFHGGVHPRAFKELSCLKKLVRFESKGEIVLPLVQGIGRPAKAIVNKGDSVLVGQIIAEAEGPVSANVASSCSGKVKAVEKRKTISGAAAECIVIENDGLYKAVEDMGVREDISSLTKDEILARIKKAGIIGLGGAGFPTAVKLTPKDSDAVNYVIANGAECEPYITCNDQLMQSEASSVIEGLEIVLRFFPNAKGVLALEDNKPEAARALREALAQRESKDRISVLVLQTKYPQGGERSLIQAAAGVNYPVNMLPADVGCVVQNVGTLYAVCRAVVYNEPLFSHVITVTGDAVKEPANFFVPEGTLVSELVEACGGIKEGVELKKVLAGGPMMGFAMSSLDVPVVKTTNAITLLSSDAVEEAEKEQTNCLHCGRCSTVCPQGLIPQLMADALNTGNLERFEEKLYGLECISCGCCTYICPAKRPLTQIFKQAKTEILAAKRAKAGAK